MKHIHLVTSDSIRETGLHSFIYIGELPREIRNKLVHMPWGHFWVSAPDLELAVPHNGLVFNFWRNGAMVVGGGFDPDDTPLQRSMMLDGVPDECSALISSANFKWLVENVLEPAGIEFTRHHIDHLIPTS